MDRIKCPNCGSTAQVELTWVGRDSYDNEHYREYVCGCGCTFEATFTLTNTKILDVEKERN